jgi:L-malate glycosyltransferase
MTIDRFEDESRKNRANQRSDTLLLISTHSVHTDRFMNGIAPYFKNIHLITNKTSINPAPNLGETLIVDFSATALTSTPKAIRAFSKRLNPSVVNIHQAGTTSLHGFIGLRGLGIPSLLTIWGSDVLLTPKRGWPWKLMVQYNLRQATLITCETSEISTAIRRLGGRKLQPELLNFGVSDIPDQPVVEKEQQILSCRLHGVLYRIDSIILAFSKIASRDELKGWSLVIAAHGSETDNLKQLVKELGMEDRVRFIGFLSMTELHEQYKKSSLYISVPRSDGLSISLLEAMAFGCIPIVSDLPSNREVVIDGLNGFVVSEKKSLQSAIIAAIDIVNSPEKLKALSLLNKEYVSSRACFETNMSRYAEILSALARQAGAI